MGLKIPDKSTVGPSFHGFTDATCQRNRTIIRRIRGILTRLWNTNHNCFPPVKKKVTGYPDVNPSNVIGSQVILGWFTFEPLDGPVSLFDCIFTCFGKPWFSETFWYCRSLRKCLSVRTNIELGPAPHGILDLLS